MRLITRVRNRFGDGTPRQPTCDSRVSQTSRVFSGDQSWDGEDIVMIMGIWTRALTLHRRDKEVPWPLEFSDS